MKKSSSNSSSILRSTVGAMVRKNALARRARRTRKSSIEQQVREHEAVAFDHSTALNRERPRKHRAIVGKGMKFASLAARVDGGRKLGEQGGIELAAHEACSQLLR